MAQRRMFSKTIISSARFIKMPPSTQTLYFHLGINADDDGVVEAYPIIKMIGASEDDLKVLMAKDFAIVLNDDLVTYLKDWNEHNLIRADRKIDSKYKNLLLKIPEVEIKEAKVRADNQRTTNGQPTDNQRTAQGRIGKGRIGKISKESVLAYSKQDKDLTDILYKKVKQNYPKMIEKKTKDQFEKDYEEMNRINRIDKWTYEQIGFVIEWSQTDEFWHKNIRSVKTLRRQFERLTVEIKSQKAKGQVVKI